MEVIICHCLDCDQELGQFHNSWNVIGNTYYSPVYPTLMPEDGFVASGDVRPTNFGSQDTECYLQDVRCKGCQKRVGVRCDSAPEGHKLKQNSLLLKVVKMSCISSSTKKESTLSVVNHCYFEDVDVPESLKNSRRSQSRASTAQPSHRGKSQSVRPKGARRQTTRGLMMPPPPPPAQLAWKPAPQLSEFESWAEKTILSQQQDINRISGTMERIESGMGALKDLMDDVRQLREAREGELNETTKQVDGMLGGIDNLRQEVMSLARRETNLIDALSTTFNHNLDNLAEDMGQISQKADEVDVLKAEMEQLRAKLWDLESSAPHQPEIPNHRLLEQSPVPSLSGSSLHTLRLKNPVPRIESNPLRGDTGVDATPFNSLAASSSLMPSFDGPTTRSTLGPKRKRKAIFDGQVTDPTRHSSPPELPKKRRRALNRLTTNTSISTAKNPEKETMEIFSSEHRTSPGLGLGQDRHNNLDEPEGAEHEISLRPYKPHTVLTALNQTTRRMRVSSTLPPSCDELSAQHYSTPVPLLEQTPILPGNRARRSDVMYGKHRDPDGLLLRPNGKVDGRSLRYKKPSLGNDKENETPAREIVFSEDELSEQVPTVAQNNSGKKFRAPPPVPRTSYNTQADRAEEDAEKSSTNKEEFPSPVSWIEDLVSAPNSDVEAPTVDIPRTQKQRPFRCGVCKRRFTSTRGLRYHNVHNSACKDTSKEDLPAGFTCSVCKKKYNTSNFLKHHTCKASSKPRMTVGAANSKGVTSNGGVKKSELESSSVAADAAETRRKIMAAREALVKETMERELGRRLE